VSSTEPNSPRGREDARRLVGALMPNAGDIVELRALRVRQGSSYVTASGYFDDPEKLVQAAAELDGKAEGIYVTLNRPSAGCLARSANRLQYRPQATTGDGDIESRRFVLIDVDPVRPSRVSATDEEKAAAADISSRVQQHLESLGFPAPVCSDSGNGFHLIYRVELDRDDGGLTKRFLSAIARMFDTEDAKVDQSVHNPSRIVKLCGTRSCKGDPIEGRPHRRSSITSMPDVLEAVPSELLRAVADGIPNQTARSTPASVSGTPFDIEGFIARHGLVVAREGEWNAGYRWELRDCPFSPDHTDSSAFIVRHASGAIAAGCHHNGCQGKDWKELRRLLDGESSHASSTTAAPPVAYAAQRATQAPVPRDPFPLELLPEDVQRYVTALSESRSVDVAAPAALALAGMASAIGLSRSVWDEFASWEEFPVLWVALVSRSGTRKTILVGDLFFPHQARQRALYAEFQSQLAEYQQELDAWDLRRKKSKSPEPEPRPEPPLLLHVYTTDTTPEALVDILKDCDRGVLVLCDELAAFFGGMGRYSGMKDSERSFYLSLFRGVQIKKDRKSGPPVFVERAAACVVGGVQPSVLRQCFDAAAFGSGLASRFLLVSPAAQVKQYRGGPSAEEKAAYARLIDAMFTLQLEPYSDEAGQILRRPLRVPLSEEARELLRDFVPEWSAESLIADEDMEAAMSKLEGYALRFALILRMCREVEGSAKEADPISREDLEGGIRLATWFRAEALAVYTELRADAEVTTADKLLSRVAVIRDRFGGAVTAREWHKLNTRRTSAEARSELQELVDAQLADWRPRPSGPKGGKPTIECCVRDAGQPSDSLPEDEPGCGLRGAHTQDAEEDDGAQGVEAHDVPMPAPSPPAAEQTEGDYQAPRNPQPDTRASSEGSRAGPAAKSEERIHAGDTALSVSDAFTEFVSDRFGGNPESARIESEPVFAPPQEKVCPACGHSLRWRLRPSGPWTCGRCHPPQRGLNDIEWNQQDAVGENNGEVQHG